jgi:hypothetical protein
MRKKFIAEMKGYIKYKRIYLFASGFVKIFEGIIQILISPFGYVTSFDNEWCFYWHKKFRKTL